MREDLGKLDEIYQRRFAGDLAYRNRVWRVLTTAFFSRYIGPGDTVLDLGCGYGEFINNISCARRIGMDANPDSAKHLQSDVEMLEQDCSSEWGLPADSLDVVFTSNLLEHLPNKGAVEATLHNAYRCLKPGGRFVALGPNVKYVGGRYWDFWDHHLPITEASLAEALEISGFSVQQSIPRFLPYSMSGGQRYPDALIRLYLAIPPAWKVAGRQFLVVAHTD